MMKKYLNIKNYKKVEANSKQPLSQIIENNGILLDLQCGGLGTCGKCKIILKQGTFLIHNNIVEVSEPMEALSCITYMVSENAQIAIPEKTLLKNTGQISSLFEFQKISSLEHGFALAIDIGTTTVVVILIDINSGKVLDSASSFNQQMAKGEDVSSRIAFADSENNLKELQELIIDTTINILIDEILDKANINFLDIKEVAVSANTVMSHIFAGISPISIGQSPFTPEVNFYPLIKAKDIGLKINPNGNVYIIPSISGYLGGDVVADLFLSKLNEKQKSADCALMIDLGTNSEIIFFNNDKLFASSAAAGPSFEGAGLLCGCRGIPGAIEKIKFSQNEFEISTIKNQKSIGICGSGIIDFIAECYKNEIINSLGRYDVEKLKNLNLFEEVENKGNKIIACKLDNDIVVTELDIEQILKAKAAIYAGIKILLSQQNKEICDISKIILSGGFAKYINIQNAIKIGILPKIALKKYHSIGNGSLGGAYYAIQNKDVRKKYEKSITEFEVINLNEDINFEVEFINALMI